MSDRVAVLIAAIEGGLISMEDAWRKYRLSRREYECLEGGDRSPVRRSSSFPPRLAVARGLQVLEVEFGNRSPHFPFRPEVDVYESRARLEAEAEKAHRSGCRLEGDRIMVRHGMSNTAPSRCFDHFAPPAARLCSGLRRQRTIRGFPSAFRSAWSRSRRLVH